MISAVRPNIQAYQAKAQAFKARAGIKPELRIHPDSERSILAGDPVAILTLGRRYPDFKDNNDLQLVLKGIKDRNPENSVAKALSEYIDNWVEALKPQPARSGGGMRK